MKNVINKNVIQMQIVNKYSYTTYGRTVRLNFCYKPYDIIIRNSHLEIIITISFTTHENGKFHYYFPESDLSLHFLIQLYPIFFHSTADNNLFT